MTLLSRLPRAANAARQSNGLPAPSVPADPLPVLLAHQGAEEQAEKAVWRPAYETSEWLTFGGVTGTYSLAAPYELGEISVIAFTASDQTSGTLSIGNPLEIGNAVTYDPTGSSGRMLFPFWTAAATMVPLGDNWTPFSERPTFVLSLTVANSHAAWVTVQFRRRINALAVPSYAER